MTLVNNQLNNKAFSLIEISILVVILSILLTAIVGFSGTKNEINSVLMTEQKLDRIEKAIIAFQNLHGYIPCPATRTQAPSTSAFGGSTDCSAAAPAGTTEVSTGATAVRIGTIPTKELGLPDDLMFDSWNNRFTYAVIKDLARTDTLFYGYSSGTSNILSAIDVDGNAIEQDSPSHVAYVLLSHGQDGKGSYNYQGAANISCDGTANDGENCDDDNTFRDQNIDYGTNYYDDHIRWKTYQIVKTKDGYKTWGAGNKLRYALFADMRTSGSQDSTSTGTITNLSFPDEISNQTESVTHDTNFGASVTPDSSNTRYLVRHTSVGCGVGNFQGIFSVESSGYKTPGQVVNSDSGNSPKSCTTANSTFYGDINSAKDLKAQLWTEISSPTDGRGADPGTGEKYVFDSYEIWELDR